MTEHEDSMAVEAKRRRFTLDEYHRMGEAGILHEDSRVELVEGEIIEMTPIGRRHAAVVTRIVELFTVRLAGRAIVWPQNPLLLRSLESELQPDVMLLERRRDFYASGLPEAADVRLLVEVADASLRYDRRRKVPLYARAGVGEVWLVDVDHARVEIHRTCTPEGYRDVRTAASDERLSPLAFPDVVVTGRDLLG